MLAAVAMDEASPIARPSKNVAYSWLKRRFETEKEK
jgi:hypothetical protein